jgi:hypothetical protein
MKTTNVTGGSTAIPARRGNQRKAEQQSWLHEVALVAATQPEAAWQ